MNQYIKRVLLITSALTLLVGAREIESLEGVEPAGAQRAEPRASAWTEPSPTPEGEAGEADQVTAFESSQAEQAAPSPAEPVSGEEPENVPSEEERRAILDGVNLGPPILSGDDGQVGVGPAPGTESQMGPMPMNDSSSLDPEHILGEEERDGVLDRVNRGAPLLPEGDREASEGPEPGTESDTERRSSLGWILIRIVETLLDWCQELLA
jgi:hypothetical protein